MSRKYVPWRRVKSWRCTACGECCGRYSVPLSAAEYTRMVSRYGEGVVRLHLGRPYLRRIAGRCVFLSGRLCSLQQTGLKPFACRIFPFLVRDEERKNRKEAEFWYKDECYYVYLSTGCAEVKPGKPQRWFVEQVIPEAIELHLNRRTPLRRLTSGLPEHYPRIGHNASVIAGNVAAVSIFEQLSVRSTSGLRSRYSRCYGTVSAG